MNTLAQRAKAIAERARLSPQQEQRLNAVLDREQPREWWVVKRPDQPAFEVAMNPPQTLPEMRERYPGCEVKAK